MAKKAKKEKPAKAKKEQAPKKGKSAAQMGMSLPGSRQRVSARVNVYTVLTGVACVALAAAVVVVGQAAIAVGPGSDVTAAVKLHPENGQIRLD